MCKNLQTIFATHLFLTTTRYIDRIVNFNSNYPLQEIVFYVGLFICKILGTKSIFLMWIEIHPFEGMIRKRTEWGHLRGSVG